jgi:hypothetical protein
MPATLTVHPDRTLVYSSFHGDVTEEEFLRHMDTIRLSPGFDPSFSEIIDLGGVTALRTSTEALMRRAQQETPFRSNSRHVVIAAPDLIARLARAFQTQGSETPPNLRVVRTPEEAFDYVQAA